MGKIIETAHIGGLIVDRRDSVIMRSIDKIITRLIQKDSVRLRITCRDSIDLAVNFLSERKRRIGIHHISFLPAAPILTAPVFLAADFHFRRQKFFIAVARNLKIEECGGSGVMQRLNRLMNHRFGNHRLIASEVTALPLRNPFRMIIPVGGKMAVNLIPFDSEFNHPAHLLCRNGKFSADVPAPERINLRRTRLKIFRKTFINPTQCRTPVAGSPMQQKFRFCRMVRG